MWILPIWLTYGPSDPAPNAAVLYRCEGVPIEAPGACLAADTGNTSDDTIIDTCCDEDD